MINRVPQQLDPESLCQLIKEELVKIIIEQTIVIEQLQATIKELKQEIERLRISRNLVLLGGNTPTVIPPAPYLCKST